MFLTCAFKNIEIYFYVIIVFNNVTVTDFPKNLKKKCLKFAYSSYRYFPESTIALFSRKHNEFLSIVFDLEQVKVSYFEDSLAMCLVYRNLIN